MAEARPQTQIVCKDKEHLFCRNSQHVGVNHSSKTITMEELAGPYLCRDGRNYLEGYIISNVIGRRQSGDISTIFIGQYVLYLESG